jgi:hypothetical protein
MSLAIFPAVMTQYEFDLAVPPEGREMLGTLVPQEEAGIEVLHSI